MSKLHLFAFSLLASALFLSCKKNRTEVPSPNENIPFKYEVICSKGAWSGRFVTQDGGWSQTSKATSGWTYSGITPKRLFIASIVTQPDPLIEGVEITINIYFDGKIVKTQTLTTSNENMINQSSYVNR